MRKINCFYQKFIEKAMTQDNGMYGEKAVTSVHYRMSIGVNFGIRVIQNYTEMLTAIIPCPLQ